MWDYHVGCLEDSCLIRNPQWLHAFAKLWYQIINEQVKGTKMKELNKRKNKRPWIYVQFPSRPWKHTSAYRTLSIKKMNSQFFWVKTLHEMLKAMPIHFEFLFCLWILNDNSSTGENFYHDIKAIGKKDVKLGLMHKVAPFPFPSTLSAR